MRKTRLLNLLATQQGANTGEFEDFPQIEKYAGEGTGDKIRSKVAETGTEIFPDKNFHDAVEITEFIDSYNALVPESNGNGAFETVSSPEIAQPNEAFADTFLAVPNFLTVKKV